MYTMPRQKTRGRVPGAWPPSAGGAQTCGRFKTGAAANSLCVAGQKPQAKHVGITGADRAGQGMARSPVSCYAPCQALNAPPGLLCVGRRTKISRPLRGLRPATHGAPKSARLMRVASLPSPALAIISTSGRACQMLRVS